MEGLARIDKRRLRHVDEGEKRMRWYYNDNRPSSWRKYHFGFGMPEPEEISEEAKKRIEEVKRLNKKK